MDYLRLFFIAPGQRACALVALTVGLGMAVQPAQAKRPPVAPSASAPDTPVPDVDTNIDPYEPYNRFMFGVNDKIDRAILQPVAVGYTKVVPAPARTGISNVFANLNDLSSAANNLLRLDITRASTDLVRFGLNTTFGFGGLINLADATQMPNNKTTLGDTFASWGWKDSHYFVYPIYGPSTVRDSVGLTISQVAFPPEYALLRTAHPGWYYGTTALKAVDKRVGYLTLTDGLDMAALDRYSYARDAYMSMRQSQIERGMQPLYPKETPDAAQNPDNAASTTSTVIDEPAAAFPAEVPSGHPEPVAAPPSDAADNGTAKDSVLSASAPAQTPTEVAPMPAAAPESPQKAP